jgi:ribonuclease P protein component
MTGPSPLSLRLPKNRRIKQGRDFARIKTEGKRMAQGCVVANWKPMPADSLSRIGVITSRHIGNAVTRNRARRVLREIFRLHQHVMTQPLDLVLVARPSIVGKTFGEVQSDLLTILRRAGMIRPHP